MEEEWDAEGFEPKGLNTVESKWADEDADDEVKDNWEDEEEEEKKDTEKQENKSELSTQPPKKNKKNLARKIEEKERQRVEEVLEELTPEQKIALKLRQQKLQEEADLKVARETFGVGEGSTGAGIDGMFPATREEFDEFGKALAKKIVPFTSAEHYPAFIEDLVRNICVNMNSLDIKKLKNTIDNLQLEKAKIEKGDKAKKSKGKGKAKLRIEGDSAMVSDLSAYGDMDEYDDFM